MFGGGGDVIARPLALIPRRCVALRPLRDPLSSPSSGVQRQQKLPGNDATGRCPSHHPPPHCTAPHPLPIGQRAVSKFTRSSRSRHRRQSRPVHVICCVSCKGEQGLVGGRACLRVSFSRCLFCKVEVSSARLSESWNISGAYAPGSYLARVDLVRGAGI